MQKQSDVFMSWKDLIISPFVQVSILLVAVLITWRLDLNFGLSVFSKVVIFYIIQVALSIAVIRLLLLFFPLREGQYSPLRDPVTCYIWNLIGYILVTNLYLHYIHGLCPPPLRKFFYRMLGAKMGKGIISITGIIVEPCLVTIEEGALIGLDAILCAHALTSMKELILGEIHIKKGAVIGTRVIISPGVTVGEQAMVMMGAVVTRGTVIPPKEVWGGIPAKKIRDIA